MEHYLKRLIDLGFSALSAVDIYDAFNQNGDQAGLDAFLALFEREKEKDHARAAFDVHRVPVQ